MAEIFEQQRSWLDDFWARSDVEVADQPAVQQAIRWNLFQLAQATARTDGDGVAAKGVSGSGYGGHYFWDSEVYVLPFLSYTAPIVARNVLRFRQRMLDAARARALELNQRGALFPWRTINGQESSAYYAAGTAQYHIDADISYALCQYVAATGDEDFLGRGAIDILVETARMWEDLGFWRSQRRRRVPHPRRHRARRVHDGRERQPVHERDGAVQPRVGGSRGRQPAGARPGRVPQARRAARGRRPPRSRAGAGPPAHMHIPYDEQLGIHPQDSAFLQKELWDLENTPEDRRPLLLHYHPLVIYRFQVLKQADVVLALYLQGDRFTDRDEARELRVLRPADHGRLDAVGGRAVDHRGRGRLPRARDPVLPLGALRRPRRPAPQRGRRRARRLDRRRVERPRRRASADSATTTASSPSTRACPTRGRSSPSASRCATRACA